MMHGTVQLVEAQIEVVLCPATHCICSSVEAAEMFAVARAKVEQRSNGLTICRVQAFHFEGINGGEIGRVGQVVGGHFGGRPRAINAFNDGPRCRDRS